MASRIAENEGIANPAYEPGFANDGGPNTAVTEAEAVEASLAAALADSFQLRQWVMAQ
jgi:hypothetical protein